MQALEFAHALKEITHELRVQELLDVVQPWTNPGASNQIPVEQKQHFTKLLFSSYSGYEKLMTRPSTRKVLEELNVAEFWEASRLEGMVARASNFNQAQQLWNAPDNFRMYFTFAGLLRWFSKMESAARHLLENEKKGETAESEGVVELELIEYENEDGIPADRFKLFVSTIMELHLCLAYIHGLKDDKLTFKYLDSGSKFTVAVECAKVIAETMTILAAFFWDKFRYWGHDTFNKNLETASKAFSFVELVDQQVKKGVLTPEDGGKWKARTLAAAEKLTGLGATSPMDDELKIDRRKLLAEHRDTKLLG